MSKTITMDTQRVRNLTTQRLHTKMSDIYEDLELLMGEKGLYSHMLVRAIYSVRPFLKKVIKDDRFWNGEFDTKHTGTISFSGPTKTDRAEMFDRFEAVSL